MGNLTFIILFTNCKKFNMIQLSAPRGRGPVGFQLIKYWLTPLYTDGWNRVLLTRKCSEHHQPRIACGTAVAVVLWGLYSCQPPVHICLPRSHGSASISRMFCLLQYMGHDHICVCFIRRSLIAEPSTGRLWVGVHYSIWSTMFHARRQKIYGLLMGWNRSFIVITMEALTFEY